jgi:hypothetical protein
MVERGFADKVEPVVLSSDTRERESGHLRKYFILATIMGVLAVGLSLFAIFVAVDSAH